MASGDGPSRPRDSGKGKAKVTGSRPKTRTRIIVDDDGYVGRPGTSRSVAPPHPQPVYRPPFMASPQAWPIPPPPPQSWPVARPPSQSWPVPPPPPQSWPVPPPHPHPVPPPQPDYRPDVPWYNSTPVADESTTPVAAESTTPVAADITPDADDTQACTQDSADHDLSDQDDMSSMMSLSGGEEDHNEEVRYLRDGRLVIEPAGNG